jgi:LCP family protein required for cell wall assembly
MTYTEQDARGRPSPDGRRGSGSVYGERPVLKGKKNRKSNRPPDPWQAKTAVILGAVLMVLSGFVVVGGKIFTSLANNTVKTENLLPDNMKAAGNNINGPVNILMLGMDERTNSTATIRTDSIIVVHINAAHDHVYLVSLPRDTMVQVPAYPASGFRGGTLKLTESFGVGNQDKQGHGDDSPTGRARGVGLLTAAINVLVPNLKFNAVAMINFVGFQKLVEALGGVDMCIDQRVESVHYAKSGKYMGEDIYHGPGYVYLPGCRHLQPWEALDYVRQRENLPHGDYDRQRHQQQFLQAIFKQLASAGTLTNISKFGQLRDAVGSLLTLDLGNAQVADWIFSFKSIRPSDVTMIQTNGGNYSSQDVDGKSYQVLSAESNKLMDALTSDSLATFVASHPTWVASAGGTTAPTATPTK